MTDNLFEKTIVSCSHCQGTGKITLPPGIETTETFYYGCGTKEGGHYWFDKKINSLGSKRDRALEERIGLGHYHIDTGYCPGRIAGDDRIRNRREVEGEAALHHFKGWTILSFWDRSIDERPGSNSNFVSHGTFDFDTMKAIAAKQYPTIWNRFKFEIKLVEEKEHA